MSEHDHHHGHATDDPTHPRNAPLSDVSLRVRALESLLVEKGLVDPAALDELIDQYEDRATGRGWLRAPGSIQDCKRRRR
jgi:nitrile hydratase